MPNEVQRFTNNTAGSSPTSLNTLTVGKTNAAWVQPHSNTTWPYVYPQNHVTYVQQPVERDTYANMIEVDRGEHDATIRFYRTRNGDRKSLVKEITIPIGLLDWLKEETA